MTDEGGVVVSPVAVVDSGVDGDAVREASTEDAPVAVSAAPETEVSERVIDEVVAALRDAIPPACISTVTKAFISINLM